MTTNNPLLKITGMLNQFLLNVETVFLSGITIFWLQLFLLKLFVAIFYFIQ